MTLAAEKSKFERHASIQNETNAVLPDLEVAALVAEREYMAKKYDLEISELLKRSKRKSHNKFHQGEKN